jgi:hypothetical protein
MDIKDIEKNMKYISTYGETLNVDEQFIFIFIVDFDYVVLY